MVFGENRRFDRLTVVGCRVLLEGADACGNNGTALCALKKICREFVAERSNQFGSSKVPP
jgi:hypothetical protein